MKGLEQEYSPTMAFLWCLFTIGFFVLLVTLAHPIIAAAGYTVMSIVVYRICHATFTQMGIGGSEIRTANAHLCKSGMTNSIYHY